MIKVIIKSTVAICALAVAYAVGNYRGENKVKKEFAESKRLATTRLKELTTEFDTTAKEFDDAIFRRGKYLEMSDAEQLKAIESLHAQCGKLTRDSLKYKRHIAAMSVN